MFSKIKNLFKKGEKSENSNNSNSSSDVLKNTAEYREDNNVWGPTIDYNKCKNCTMCYKFCKYGVYSIENGKVVVKNKSNCIDGCSMCLDVCRYGALIFP